MSDQQTQTKKPHALTVLKEQLDARAPSWAANLPPHISVDKFKSVVMTAVTQNPQLIGADRLTFFLACKQAATDGLLPDGRDGALVIYDTKIKVDGQDEWIKAVQWLRMVGGIRKLVRNSGLISDLKAEVVYERDTFEYYETAEGPHFKYQPHMGSEEPGSIRGAFSRVILKDGTVSIKTMSHWDIERIRLRSSKSKDKDGAPKSAWKDHYGAMCAKTVFKSHAKELPQSTDLLTIALDYTDEEDGRADTRTTLPAPAQHRRPQLEDFSEDLPVPMMVDPASSEGEKIAVKNEAEKKPAKAAATSGKKKPEPEAQPPHDPETGEVQDGEVIPPDNDSEAQRRETPDDEVVDGPEMTADAAYALGSEAARKNLPRRPPPEFRDDGVHAAFAEDWRDGWDREDTEKKGGKS